MKMIIPTLLFIFLSPGIVVPRTNNFLILSLLYMMIDWVASKAVGDIVTRADLIVPSVLFFLLASRSGNMNSVMIRAFIFILLFVIIRKLLPDFF